MRFKTTSEGPASMHCPRNWVADSSYSVHALFSCCSGDQWVTTSAAGDSRSLNYQLITPDTMTNTVLRLGVIRWHCHSVINEQSEHWAQSHVQWYSSSVYTVWWFCLLWAVNCRHRPTMDHRPAVSLSSHHKPHLSFIAVHSVARQTVQSQTEHRQVYRPLRICRPCELYNRPDLFPSRMAYNVPKPGCSFFKSNFICTRQ